MEVNIGGDRLGSGNKKRLSLKNYERSSHDLGYIWRSSMASGTLVPFMKYVALPGDTFDIELNAEVLTLPTLGPVFGSYKVQMDVFECAIRLYQGKLHMNMLNIGMNMSDIKLPRLAVDAYWDEDRDENQQINPSSLWKYLGISGCGTFFDAGQPALVKRYFNAVPYLAYWDIYKQYYANKQEERGFVIHTDTGVTTTIVSALWTDKTHSGVDIFENTVVIDGTGADVQCDIAIADNTYAPNVQNMTIAFNRAEVPLTTAFSEVAWNSTTNLVECRDLRLPSTFSVRMNQQAVIRDGDTSIQLREFPLENIDTMRQNILADVANPNAFTVDYQSIEPYNLPLQQLGGNLFSVTQSQEGLGIKTYQSDLFNNWISTDWIEGTNGVNEITAVSTAGDEFTIDALNLANKVYNMLNRIALSGGSYDDWLDAVYTQERTRGSENPVYLGSLIKELTFQEVISQSDTQTPYGEKPLGTLAGRGRMTDKHKGGKIRVKTNEPCYILALVSITPRIDFSQGNDWDMNLETMDDLHKPALDQIGFQDLLTDQMAWWDTTTNASGGTQTFKTAGKQPAWINYMTETNKVRGNFADPRKEMFMVLNRRYNFHNGATQDSDITTYIDPSKFNHIFADTSLDAQNFWVQIKVDTTARRKMSAKIIPNL